MALRILVPVDVEHPESWTAVTAELSRLLGDRPREFHALYVLPEIGSALVGAALPEGFEREALETARRDLATLLAEGPPSEAHVAHGPVDGEILATARRLDAGLLAMLAHDPTLGARILGSPAATVAQEAACPVLLVHATSPKR